MAEKLRVGAIGAEVARLHEELQRQGFEIPESEVSREFFGPGTREAVLACQREHGLACTGEVDPPDNTVTVEDSTSQQEDAINERCDAGLLLELAIWQNEGADPGRRVDVFVTFSGDIGELTAAGLKLGHFDGEVATGSIQLADIDAVEAVDGVQWIALSAPLRWQLDRSIPAIRATELRTNAPPHTGNGTPGYTGEGVLIGVIDDTISVFHPSVTKVSSPPTTRLVAIWDQVHEPRPGEASPAGFNYGTLWEEGVINDVLATDIGPTSERRIRMGERDHGTHVTGIAAGNSWLPDGQFPPFTFEGVAPKADLIFCSVGFGLSAAHAADGMNFIFSEAAKRGKACVVNMSFSTDTATGARDGTSALELAIDRALHGPDGQPVPGRAVVVAAGNDATARRHGMKALPTAGTAAFRLNVEQILLPSGSTLTQDVKDDAFCLWYHSATRIKARLTSPGARPGDWFVQGKNNTLVFQGRNVATASWGNKAQPNGKQVIVVALREPVRFGSWIIELQHVSGPSTTVDLWIAKERGDDDIWPQLAEAGTEVKNTIACPSTAKSAISVGAYIATGSGNSSVDGDGQLWASSSRGLDTTDGIGADQIRPHLVAPGERIISARYIDTSVPKPIDVGVRYGTGWFLNLHTEFRGTSQAAPHVSGVVALMFQKNPTLTFKDVRQILMGTAQVPPGTVLPNGAWGAGKLDAAAALGLTPPHP